MKRRRFRILPLLNIHGTWDRKCRYPTVLDVAMDDGKFIKYSINYPVHLNVGKHGWNSGRTVVGYQYKSHPQ